MSYRDKVAQDILVDVFTNADQYDESTVTAKMNELLSLGWSEDQVILMLEVMTLEIAKEQGTTGQVIAVIKDFWDTRKAG